MPEIGPAPADADPGFGVYVHWPYCARICPYCDFNVYRNRAVDETRWRAALIRDLTHWADLTGPRALHSIYFGGGTPSLASPDLIAAVIDACKALWRPVDGIEITLEANPTDAERDRFAAFRTAGVDRLSLGVQSFNDDALRFLGRNHDGAGAQRALDAALSTFDRVNFDLIYALPDETPADWRKALRGALALGADHLSAYQLTVEPGTAFERAARRGTLATPDEATGATLYDVTQEETARAGLPAYEISNHARGGAASRHNLVYWRGGDYAGVGPGAHGRLTLDGARRAIETAAAPAAYLEQVETDGTGARVNEALDAGAQLAERLSMGLRLIEGVALSPDQWAAIDARARPLVEDGLLIRAENRLRASADGRRVLNGIVSALLI